MNIAEMRRAKAALIEQMKVLHNKDTDASPWSDEDRQAYAGLCKQVDDHEDRLTRAEDIIAREVASAEPADDAEEMGFEAPVRKSNVVIRGTGYKTAAQRKSEPKGTQFARFVIGAGIVKMTGSLEAGVSYVRDGLGDAEVAKSVAGIWKAVMGATGSQAAGGALIPQDFRAELLDLLYAQTVVRSAPGIQNIPMPYGNLTIPRLASASQAYWQGENLDATTSTLTWGDLQLSAKKLTALVPVSNDLVRRSPLTVEAIIRDNMSKMLARAEDLAFISGVGTATSPVGLTTLVQSANQHTVSGAFNLTTVNNALQTMILDLEANNVSTDGAVWLTHPSVVSALRTIVDGTGRYFFAEELASGKLLGHDIRTTTQVVNGLGAGSNATTMVFWQPKEMIIADTLQMFADSSSEAAYPLGNAVVSSYSRDQVLFRVIEEVDFGTAYPMAISTATITGWQPSFFTGTSNVAVQYTAPVSTANGSASLSANPSGV